MAIYGGDVDLRVAQYLAKLWCFWNLHLAILVMVEEIWSFYFVLLQHSQPGPQWGCLPLKEMTWNMATLSRWASPFTWRWVRPCDLLLGFISWDELHPSYLTDFLMVSHRWLGKSNRETETKTGWKLKDKITEDKITNKSCLLFALMWLIPWGIVGCVGVRGLSLSCQNEVSGFWRVGWSK